MTKPLVEARAPLNLDFTLTEEEKRSPLWAKIMRAAEARVWKLRVANDEGKDDVRTQEIRNEIKFLKGLLKNDPSHEFSAPTHRVVTLEDLDAAE